MSFFRTLLICLLALPGYTYASFFSDLGVADKLYVEGYYTPSVFKNNVVSVRSIAGKQVSSGIVGNSSGTYSDHDVKMNSSIPSALGISAGFGIGNGVGLKVSLDYGDFGAKKVGSYRKGAAEVGPLWGAFYVSSRISGISTAALTVSVCYERLTAPGPVLLGVYLCAGGGASFAGVYPGSFMRLSPNFKVRTGVSLPLGRSLSLTLGAFYRGVFGSSEYESKYGSAVSPDGVEASLSKIWGSSGVESLTNLSDLGVEVGLRFNLRLDST